MFLHQTQATQRFSSTMTKFDSETGPWLMFFNLGKIQIYVFLMDDKKL